MSTSFDPATAPEPTDALYREVVLEHYREPSGREPIDAPDVTGEGINPSCGDELDLALRVDESGRIVALQVESRGCAISVASGSILHDLVDGVTPAEARRVLAGVRETLTGAGLPDEPDLGDFDALEGVRDFPVRIKCALLPWTTLEEALADLDRVLASRADNTPAGNTIGDPFE